MTRFFVPKEQITENAVSIIGDDVKHITKVLRLRSGDLITVLDGGGMEYRVRLEEMDSSVVSGAILSRASTTSEPVVKVTVIQGLPKGDKMDTVIQKCTELGAYDFIPLITQRTVVNLSGDKSDKKAGRWQRIAQEAAEQARRGVVPKVHQPITCNALSERLSSYDLILVAWEGETTMGLKSCLASMAFRPEHVAILIGPEGGLTSQEVEGLQELGARSASLGPRILRTETAAVALLSMLLYHYGEMGGN